MNSFSLLAVRLVSLVCIQRFFSCLSKISLLSIVTAKTTYFTEGILMCVIFENQIAVVRIRTKTHITTSTWVLNHVIFIKPFLI